LCPFLGRKNKNRQGLRPRLPSPRTPQMSRPKSNIRPTVASPMATSNIRSPTSHLKFQKKSKTVQKLRIFAVQHGFLHFWIPCLESLTP
jgi:hypothetical protein